MAKIQCISCGGMAELDNGSTGECPYCGNTVTIRRYSAVKYVKAPERIKLQGKLKAEKPSADNHMAQGLFYLQANNCTLAYAQFEKAVEMNCECAESYYYKSLAQAVADHDKQQTESLCREIIISVKQRAEMCKILK